MWPTKFNFIKRKLVISFPIKKGTMRPKKIFIFHICAKFHKQEKGCRRGGGGWDPLYSQKARFFLFFKTRMLKSSVFLYFETARIGPKIKEKNSRFLNMVQVDSQKYRRRFPKKITFICSL
jgi:hypothetical protein